MIGSRPSNSLWIRNVGESVRIIAVGMATRDREDALRDQIPDPVRHPLRRAGVGDRRRERGQQADPAVGGVEQDRAAVRTRVGLIKGGHQGTIGQVRKQNSLCYCRLVQRRRLPGKKARVVTALYHVEAFVFLPTYPP